LRFHRRAECRLSNEDCDTGSFVVDSGRIRLTGVIHVGDSQSDARSKLSIVNMLSSPADVTDGRGIPLASPYFKISYFPAMYIAISYNPSADVKQPQ